LTLETLRWLEGANVAVVRVPTMAFHQFAEREVGTAFQDLVRKLQEAAETELRQVREQLEGDLDTIRRQADTLRDELETESARAATLEADLDSVIEAHRAVDGERLKAEASLAERTRACAEAEEELSVVRELLDTARGEHGRLQEAFEAEAALKALLETDLLSSRQALAKAEARVRTLEASIRELEATGATLEAELTEAREAAEAGLRHAQEDAEVRLRESRAATEAALRQAREEADAHLRQVRDEHAAELRQAQTTAETQVREALTSAEAQVIEARAAAEAQLRDVRDSADAQLRAARETAEAELRQARETHQRELRDALDAASAQSSRAAELTTRLESSREELADARVALAAAQESLRDRTNDVQRRDDVARQLEAQLAETRAVEAAIRAAADEAREQILQLRAEAESEAARLAAAVTRAEAAEASGRLAQDELALVRDQTDPAEILLQASIRALESLAASTSVAALISGLSRQLAPHFARVAIFRVKGHHLEGEQGAGLDPSIDITKLSIPAGTDSAITRAAATRAIQDLDLLALAEEPTALGGSPGAALAVPIVFQGDTFAVAYVDRDDGIELAHRAFATLLAGQASVLLGRLSQELKLMKELRDYAALLVQEAEQMFVADLENGRPEAERRRRLAETIECARQLFSQRAALDGPAAARALDEYLLEVMTAPNDSPFAADLTVVVAETSNSERRTPNQV
jgi:chromosome segregation ATPase